MKRILCAVLALGLTVSMCACGTTATDTTGNGTSETVGEKVEDAAETLENDVKDDVEAAEDDVKEGAETVAADFETIEQEAIEKVDSMEEVTEEDVRNSIDYIEEHAEEAMEDSEVAKQVAHYAACLKYWTTGVDHEIADYAESAYNYAKALFKTGEEEEEVAAEDALADLKAAGEKISAEKDKLITEIHDLVYNK